VQVKAAITFLALCACVPTALGDSKTPAAAKGACTISDEFPYVNQPTDPWLAVANGKPRSVAVSKLGYQSHSGKATCDAAHDHCLRDCEWLLTPDPTHRRATPFLYANNKFWDGNDASKGFVAYRTVPVTRKNLAKGMLVAALTDSYRPQLEGGRLDDDGKYVKANGYWDMGIVESIEWEKNLVRLEGVDEPYYLTGTRLAVLKYVDGGTVEKIVDAKAPAIAELAAPAKAAAPSDPWSQVGKDKQPIAVTDDSKLSGNAAECTTKTDHCLRPWVWFVTVEGRPVAARWTGKNFVAAEDPKRVIEKPGVAYRTRPAKESDLKEGTKIIMYAWSTKPNSEKDAHFWRGWTFETVEKVDHYKHEMQVKGEDPSKPVENARVMVLFWLPGEKAEAVE